MKKFAFSLERVLDYKRQMLEMLENELLRLEEEQMGLELQIEEKNREFGVTGRALAEKMSRGLQPHRIAAYQGYLEELNRCANLLLERRRAVLERAEAKREEIVRMNGDISGLERLRDRQFAQYLALGRKQQEVFIEEFVGRAGVRAG